MKRTIDSTRFRRVFRINVTLDLINNVSSSLWELGEMGLAADVERCWSVSLNDLRVVVEILDRPVFFVHYLVRRLDLNSLKTVEAGDELEYLMHYVRHGLFFHESNAPKENEHIRLVRYTDDLDRYYSQLQGLIEKAEKPRVPVPPKTLRLLKSLQEQKPKHWMSYSLALMEFEDGIREHLVSREQEHLKQLMLGHSTFGLSSIESRRNGSSLALATSFSPRAVEQIVVGRCLQHCQHKHFEEVWLLIQGVPLGKSEMIVRRVTPDSTISDSARHLLDQLQFRPLDSSKRQRPS